MKVNLLLNDLKLKDHDLVLSKLTINSLRVSRSKQWLGRNIQILEISFP